MTEPQLTEAQREERRQKADRATRAVLAALLCLEALVMLLVPRAIAQTSTGLDAAKTITLVALAVVLVATAGLLRRRWGIGVGSVLQVLVLATAVWERALVVIGLMFIGLWWWVLTMRRDLAGKPGGLRMLVS
jgi:Protein of unknown function (DUF4233)